MFNSVEVSSAATILIMVFVLSLAGTAAAKVCPEGDLDGGCEVDWEDVRLFCLQWLESRVPAIEAEEYSSKTAGSGAAAGSSWVDLTGNGSSGDGYVHALPDIGLAIDTNIEAESPHMSYDVDFPAAGTYYLWLKGQSDDFFSQFVHYGLDGSATSSGILDAATLSHDETFTWKSLILSGSGRPSVTVGSEGEHTLDIWMREDGAKIDRLLLTDDIGYLPEYSEELTADFTGDYRVDFFDYAILAKDWLVEVVTECEDWQTLHPEWLFCDDFETEQDLSVNYNDISTNGMFVSENDAFGGTYSLEQHYIVDQNDAGWVIKFVGDNPRLNPPGPKYDEIYARWYHKFEEGFVGYPPKMARIRLQNSDWWGYVTVHQWIDIGGSYDGRFCADTHVNGEDRWLPIAHSTLDYSNPVNIGKWICIEVRIKLNTPGQSNGEIEYWADGVRILLRTGQNMRSSYDDYGLNFVMLDCYWNAGSPVEQSRYYDNFVISTAPIGPKPW